ncbi:P-loop containing nucleoside triphosphate hydrolase protein, partial [Phaeosphaeriaceae sp. PMI808]
RISSKYALVVRQVLDSDGNLRETLVDIRGEGLRNILITILEGAEGLRLNEKPPVIKPQLLYHCVPKLRHRLEKEQANDSKDDALIFDIQAALQLVGEDFVTEEASIQSLLSSNRITFVTLWAIFPPNELVYTVDRLFQPNVYRAVDYSIKTKPDGSLAFALSIRSIDSDGTRLGWTSVSTLEIPMFPGEKLISDLPAYPLRFHEESASVRRDLICRGYKRLSLHKHGLHEYTGHALQERQTPDGFRHLEKFGCQGRIIVDHACFKENQPNSVFVPTIKIVLFEDQLTEDQLITLPAVVYGFSLVEKAWGGFAVSQITEVQWDHSIWDSLVLPDIHKRLVRTMVKSYIAHSENFDDFVRGKGKGLVGLLAGPPGVGKTLTAEAVAEIAERPLYMLSSGELGSDPDKIDQKLREILRLAQIWKAVLLLDEADVFMATRSDADITRNTIVSIFLRQLEYYQGILILTTNRVEKIDDAFQSRVHFQLSYPDLDHEARESIWRNFLGRVSRTCDVAVGLEGAEINRLAEMNINGRQVSPLYNCNHVRTQLLTLLRSRML